MKRSKKGRLKRVSSVTILVISLILTLGTILAANSADLDQFSTELNEIIEKTAEIEIWADTYLNLKIINNNINAVLALDNKTALPEQEIKLYLNENLISTSTTNSEGSALFSNLNEISRGNYLLKAKFQSDPSLYLNPSSAEKQIEVIEKNDSIEIKFMNETGETIILPLILNQTQLLNQTNQTSFLNQTLLLNQTVLTAYTDKKIYTQNETITIFGELTINGEKRDAQAILEITFNKSVIFISKINLTAGNYSYSRPANFEKEGKYSVVVLAGGLSAETNFDLALNNNSMNIQNVNCKEFREQILWSSGYSNDKKGSTNYQAWTPKHNCSEAEGQNCFLGEVEILTRFIYFGEDNESGDGYIQLSDSDEAVCGNPEQGIYLKYLAYETLHGESKKLNQHCGSNKNPNGKCGVDLTDSVKNIAKCYGIKSKAAQHLIVDAFAVKYTLCWNQNE